MAELGRLLHGSVRRKALPYVAYGGGVVQNLAVRDA